MQLAQQIVEIYHGRASGEAAHKAFIDTFQNKGLPENIPEINAVKGTLLSDVLVEAAQVTSKSEFRRLIDEGAIRIGGEEKISDPFFKINVDTTLKIGKHRFVKIVVS